MIMKGITEGVVLQQTKRQWGEQSGKLNRQLMDVIQNDLAASESELQELQERQNMQKSAGEKKAPYQFLADEGGIINYKGVIFSCNQSENRLELGDVSNPKKCINIPLSKGGSLLVNRENIDQLGHAIGMFSPEDVKLILRALSLDAKVRGDKEQAEEEKLEIGKEKEKEEN